MNLNGILGHAFGRALYDGKEFIRDFDGLSGGNGLFPGFRQDSRNRVPDISNRCITENRTIGHDQFQAVGAFNIFGGHDSDHARHFFGSGRMNGFDSRMGVGAVDHGQFRRAFHPDVG